LENKKSPQLSDDFYKTLQLILVVVVQTIRKKRFVEFSAKYFIHFNEL